MRASSFFHAFGQTLITAALRTLKTKKKTVSFQFNAKKASLSDGKREATRATHVMKKIHSPRIFSCVIRFNFFFYHASANNSSRALCLINTDFFSFIFRRRQNRDLYETKRGGEGEEHQPATHEGENCLAEPNIFLCFFNVCFLYHASVNNNIQPIIIF